MKMMRLLSNLCLASLFLRGCAAYSILFLNFRWPATHCKTLRCVWVPKKFTIHSFSGNYDPFNKKWMLGDIYRTLDWYKQDLVTYWPDLEHTRYEDGKPYWKRLYKKDGPSTRYSADDYFSTAIGLARAYQTILLKSLQDQGIKPNDEGKKFDPQKIGSAVMDRIQHIPDIICRKIGDHYYLWDIVLCFTKNYERLRDCSVAVPTFCPDAPRGEILNFPKG